MDRHKVSSNRHKGNETFKSGCEKRKIANEKERKHKEVIVKTRRMTDFLKSSSCSTSTPATSSTLPQDCEENYTVSLSTKNLV